MHLFGYPKVWLPQLVCGVVHDLDYWRIVIILPVNRPFLPTLGSRGGLNAHSFGNSLLGKLVHDIRSQVNHVVAELNCNLN